VVARRLGAGAVAGDGKPWRRAHPYRGAQRRDHAQHGSAAADLCAARSCRHRKVRRGDIRRAGYRHGCVFLLARTHAASRCWMRVS
jgi:hypothetical protein